jgi:hypothetical protein
MQPVYGGIPILCKEVKQNKKYLILNDIVIPPRALSSDYFDYIARINRAYMDLSPTLGATTEVSLSTDDTTIIFKSMKIPLDRVIAIVEVYGGFTVLGAGAIGMPTKSPYEFEKDLMIGPSESVLRAEQIYYEGIIWNRRIMLNLIKTNKEIQEEARRERREEEREREGEEEKGEGREGEKEKEQEEKG